MLSIHRSIISLMQELYNVEDGGVCESIHYAGLLAFFCDDIETFNKRNDLIQGNIADILDDLDGLKKRIATLSEQDEEIELDEDDKALIDIAAYLDVLALLQQPENFSEFFHQQPISDIRGNKYYKAVMQGELEKILPFITSKLLAKKGKIVKSDAWPGIYSRVELKKFLSSLLLAGRGLTQNIAITFTATNHTISLCYNKKDNSWTLINANKLPIVKLPLSMLPDAHESDLYLLTNEIVNSFVGQQGIFAFETSILSLKENKLEQDKEEDNLKEDHNNSDNIQLFLKTLFASQEYTEAHILADKVTYKTKHNTTLPYIAALKGHADYIATLHELGYDLNVPENDGFTPALIAAQYGHLDVLIALHYSGINLLEPAPNGSTTMEVAVKLHHQDIIDYLQSLQITPKTRTPVVGTDDKNVIVKDVKIMEGNRLLFDALVTSMIEAASIETESTPVEVKEVNTDRQSDENNRVTTYSDDANAVTPVDTFGLFNLSYALSHKRPAANDPEYRDKQNKQFRRE